MKRRSKPWRTVCRYREWFEDVMFAIEVCAQERSFGRARIEGVGRAGRVREWKSADAALGGAAYVIFGVSRRPAADLSWHKGPASEVTQPACCPSTPSAFFAIPLIHVFRLKPSLLSVSHILKADK